MARTSSAGRPSSTIAPSRPAAICHTDTVLPLAPRGARPVAPPTTKGSAPSSSRGDGGDPAQVGDHGHQLDVGAAVALVAAPGRRGQGRQPVHGHPLLAQRAEALIRPGSGNAPSLEDVEDRVQRAGPAPPLAARRGRPGTSPREPTTTRPPPRRRQCLAHGGHVGRAASPAGRPSVVATTAPDRLPGLLAGPRTTASTVTPETPTSAAGCGRHDAPAAAAPAPGRIGRADEGHGLPADRRTVAAPPAPARRRRPRPPPRRPPISAEPGRVGTGGAAIVPGEADARPPASSPPPPAGCG